MSKLILIVLTLFALNSASPQGNFTVEWESPVELYFKSFLQLDKNSNVIHLMFYDNITAMTVKLYNGSTHNADYVFQSQTGRYDQNNIATFSKYNTPESFDVNGNGVNEYFSYKGDSLYITDPIQGVILARLRGYCNLLADVDGDGFLEMVMGRNTDGVIKIVSTPVQTTSVNNENIELKNYELKQNYPNPFNPETTIEYTLSKNADVKVIVYDMLGKEVNTIVNQKQNAGSYKLNLQAGNLTSGTYFYTIVVNGIAESKKMILVK